MPSLRIDNFSKELAEKNNPRQKIHLYVCAGGGLHACATLSTKT